MSETPEVLRQRAEIERQAEVVVFRPGLVRHRIGQRRDRAALARDLGRHALVNLAGRPAVNQQGELRLAEHVDEAGSDDEAGCVDDRARVLATECADCRDAVTRDAHVGVNPRSAGAVHHASAGNDDIEAGRGRARRRGQREGAEACGDRTDDCGSASRRKHSRDGSRRGKQSAGTSVPPDSS